MAEARVRMSGLIAIVQHCSGEGEQPTKTTFVLLDPTKASTEFPLHHPQLAIAVEELADGVKCDRILTIREQEHTRHRQYATWDLTEYQLRLVGLQAPDKDPHRITRKHVPTKGLPESPDLPYAWRGCEWIADLRKVLGQKVSVLDSVVEGKAPQIVAARGTVGSGEFCALIPGPYYRRLTWKVGKYDPIQAFVDAAQMRMELAGDRLTVELEPMPGSGKQPQRIECLFGDVVLHMSNLPAKVERANGDTGHDVHADFASYYRLLDEVPAGPGPVPLPPAFLKSSDRARSVDPVYCMLALAYHISRELRLASLAQRD